MQEIRREQELFQQDKNRANAEYRAFTSNRDSFVDGVQSEARAYVDRISAQNQHTFQMQAAEIHDLRVDLQGQKVKNEGNSVLLFNQGETIRDLKIGQRNAEEARERSEQDVVGARREIEDLTLRYANDANALEIWTLTGVSIYHLLSGMMNQLTLD